MIWLLSLANAGPTKVPAFELDLLHTPSPEWPDGADEARRPKACAARVAFDEQGIVSDVKTRRCPEPFRTSASEALTTWRIEPYDDGQGPRAVALGVNVTFKPAPIEPRVAISEGADPYLAAVSRPETRSWFRTGTTPPGDATSVGEPHDWTLLVKLPQVPPRMPRQATDLGLSGSCVLLVHVDTDGRPYGAEAEACPDVFVEPSLDAVQRWRLEPPRKDGVPQRSSVRVQIDYSI